MGMNYLLKLSDKELFFQINSENYLRLNNTIISELSLNHDISKDFVRFVLQEFHFLVENSNYEIPNFIKKKIKKNFSEYNIPPYIDIYVHNQKKIKNCMETLYKKKQNTTTSKNNTSKTNTPKLQYNIPTLIDTKSPAIKHKMSSPSTFLKSYSIDSYKTYLSLEDFNMNIANSNNLYMINEKQECSCESYDINSEHILSSVVICKDRYVPISPIIKPYDNSNNTIF